MLGAYLLAIMPGWTYDGDTLNSESAVILRSGVDTIELTDVWDGHVRVLARTLPSDATQPATLYMVLPRRHPVAPTARFVRDTLAYAVPRYGLR